MAVVVANRRDGTSGFVLSARTLECWRVPLQKESGLEYEVTIQSPKRQSLTTMTRRDLS